MNAVYARQSVEKLDSLSIETQIDSCLRMLDGAYTVYQDRGFSGKNTKRPAFTQLMEDVRNGKVSKIWVYRLDRFSRSLSGFCQLWAVLERNHVEFESVTEKFDTSTPSGRAMIILFALIFSFRLDSHLSFIFLGVIPVLAIGLGAITLHVHPIFVRVFHSYDHLNNIVQENLHGIRVVKSYIREEFEEHKFEAVSQSIFDDFTKAEKRLAFNMPLMQFCLYTSMILDEATSSIDTRTEAIVQKGMDALMKGRTVFVIAHRLSTVQNSDVIMVLEHGVIIERGSHEQLIEEKGKYYQLYTGAFELE